MKKQILTGLLAMLICLPAMAQKRGDYKDKSPEEKAKMMTERMTEKLKLNEDQQTAVYQAHLEVVQAQEKSKDEKEALREAHDAKMKSILTEEQYAEYVALRDQRKKRMRDMRKKRAMRDNRSSSEQGFD